MRTRLPVLTRPRRLPLSACLAAMLGLAFSTAEAVPFQGGMHRPNHRRAVVPSATLPFQKIAAVLQPGGPSPGNPASGTLHHVTSCDDDPNDPGTLRNIVSSPSTVSGDSIDFVQLPIMCSSTITLSQGQAIEVFQDTLYLEGPGAAALTIDGNDSSSVLYHLGAGTLYVSGLTIAHGQYVGSNNPAGGCIRSASHVFLRDSIVSHCVATSSDANVFAAGGGVYTGGNLTLVRSTISSSHAFSQAAAYTFGGGAFVRGDFFSHYSSISGDSASGTGHTRGGGLALLGSVADIEGSTISENAAEIFGGLVAGAGTGTFILNSTISGNVAWLEFAGATTYGTLILDNSTIAFNRSISGPSVNRLSVGGAALTLQSSIVADNAGPLGSSDLGGLSGANNLVVSSTLPLPVGGIFASNFDGFCDF